MCINSWTLSGASVYITRADAAGLFFKHLANLFWFFTVDLFRECHASVTNARFCYLGLTLSCWPLLSKCCDCYLYSCDDVVFYPFFFIFLRLAGMDSPVILFRFAVFSGEMESCDVSISLHFFCRSICPCRSSARSAHCGNRLWFFCSTSGQERQDMWNASDSRLFREWQITARSECVAFVCVTSRGFCVGPL